MYKMSLAYLNLTLAQISVAVNFIVSKQLEGNVSVYLLLSTRFALGGLLILSIMYCLKEPFVSPAKKDKFSLKDWAYLTFQALLAGIVFNWILITGLHYTSATAAGIVSSALPVVMAVMSWMILKESLNLRKVFAIILVAIGMLSLSMRTETDLNYAPNNLLGIFIMSLALVPEAMYSILGKLTQNLVTPMGSGLYTAIVNCIVCAPLAAYYVMYNPSPILYEVKTWLIFAMLGCTTVVFYVCWLTALKHVPANTAGLFGGVMPVATAILAYIFLDERLSKHDVAGVALVVIAIFVGAGEFSKLRRKLLHTK